MASPFKINSTILEQLHVDILPKATKKAFLKYAEMSFFSTGGWYLAGGTALAAQVGHRQSVDLDFFTLQSRFNEKKIEEAFSAIGGWKTSFIDKGTVYGEMDGAKTSFIAYPFFRPKLQPVKVGSISILKPEDIAAMKIIAISQRGKKRDFFDLYWISLNNQSLSESIVAAQKQYSVSVNLTHILKSMVYFEDAESDPDPKVFFDADWKKVKSFFRKEVVAITKNLILK